MRTAIFFLILVGFLVLIGSFVPQQNTSAQTKVDDFTSGHHYLVQLFSQFGLPLTQVFVSPVFFVIAGLLYVSLGACVLRRLRALVKRVAGGWYKTTQFWGECGSWTFHAAFFVLLVAVLWGKLTGFQGLVEVTAQTSFTEARSGYDQLQEGLLFNGQHANFQVRLNSFNASYQADGVPSDFASNVSVIDHGKTVATQDVRVNSPLSYDQVSVYQQDYGWAPHIVVKNPAGAVVYDDYLQFLPGTTKAVGLGVLKVPDFGVAIPNGQQALQLGGDLSIFPDATLMPQVNPDQSLSPNATQYGPGGEEARYPVMEMKLYVGDLGLSSGPQDVDVLDTSQMVPLTQNGEAIPLVMGQSDSLPIVVNGQAQYFTVSFPDLRQFSLFMVKRDTGVDLVYLSFGMIMFGLMTKLYLVPWLKRREGMRKVELRGRVPSEQVEEKSGGHGKGADRSQPRESR